MLHLRPMLDVYGGTRKEENVSYIPDISYVNLGAGFLYTIQTLE